MGSLVRMGGREGDELLALVQALMVDAVLCASPSASRTAVCLPALWPCDSDELLRFVVSCSSLHDQKFFRTIIFDICLREQPRVEAAFQKAARSASLRQNFYFCRQRELFRCRPCRAVFPSFPVTV